MAFTYNLDTDLGEVRLEIGDNRADPAGILPEGQNLSDKEIQHFLDAEGSDIWKAVARCFDVASAAWSAYPTELRLGPESQKISAAEYFAAKAVHARSQGGKPSSVPLSKVDYAMEQT
jgi:hypothetical protein